MKKLIIGLLALAGVVSAYAADPFRIAFSQATEGSNVLVSVSVSVPSGHHVYADQVEASLEGGARLRQVGGDSPVTIHDSLSDSERPAFSRDVKLIYNAGVPTPGRSVVKFSYQGCNEQECFFPKTLFYTLRTVGLEPAEAIVKGGGERIAERTSGWIGMTGTPVISARASGYMGASDFLVFLDRAEGKDVSGIPGRTTWASRIKAGFLLFGINPVEFLKIHGAWWTILLIVIGGLLLNLTPCVLPMIPINLAILGVGAQNSTRARGLLLGSCYGLGIALVYGVLGLVVVLTGSQFGALNSMPWFNGVIGIIFVALALAMFDVFTIDFTRFQSVGTGSGSPGQGRVAAAFIMGGVAALLAGACVAPVVIAVLLLSGNLYSHGAGIGLALPFILGLGMALPWPLAGAGLTFLPKPGNWMTWIKKGFGVFILLFAVYYFSLAYQGLRGAQVSQQAGVGVYQITASDHDRWTDILRESAGSGKPVLIDFWATWCKNCEAMELTTFKDAKVKGRLSHYLVVKFQAEKSTDPATREALETFGVRGLPSYVVLKPTREATRP
ncbi:MAG: cytochrome c biogenesis protein CcdA [bacterium]